MEAFKNAFTGLKTDLKDKMMLIKFGIIIAILLILIYAFKIKIWKPKSSTRSTTRYKTRYRLPYRRRYRTSSRR